MLILLIGPKGSGKSHIGRLLESSMGIHFFHVEPLWMKYYQDCKNMGQEPVVAKGIERIHPAILASLREHQYVCVETTGASQEILNDLLNLDSPDPPLLVKVNAPLSLCLKRIAARDPMHQIPSNIEIIHRSYDLSQHIDLPFDVVFLNESLTTEQILEPFRQILSPGKLPRTISGLSPGIDPARADSNQNPLSNQG